MKQHSYSSPPIICISNLFFIKGFQQACDEKVPYFYYH